MELIERIAEAPIGVFAWRRSDGSPGSCPVTPYVVGDDVVVTSTLAFTAKAAAVRRDPHVALLAGGVFVHGRADVFVDETPRWFDEHIRAMEIEKFPPTKSILAIPGHRRLFPWYVARIVIQLRPDTVKLRSGSDRATATQLVGDALSIVPIIVDQNGQPLVEGLANGPTAVLIHEEHQAMADLRQLSLRGVVSEGAFVESRRTGSLERGRAGTVAQFCELQTMARDAKKNRETIRAWTAA